MTHTRHVTQFRKGVDVTYSFTSKPFPDGITVPTDAIQDTKNGPHRFTNVETDIGLAFHPERTSTRGAYQRAFTQLFNENPKDKKPVALSENLTWISIKGSNDSPRIGVLLDKRNLKYSAVIIESADGQIAGVIVVPQNVFRIVKEPALSKSLESSNENGKLTTKVLKGNSLRDIQGKLYPGTTTEIGGVVNSLIAIASRPRE